MMSVNGSSSDENYRRDNPTHKIYLAIKSSYNVMPSKLLCIFTFYFYVFPALSQSLPQAYNPRLFTTPLAYTAIHARHNMVMDGNFNEQDWQLAKWSEAFTDIEGSMKPRPAFNTRMKMLWDDTCLYIAAQLQEPQLNATLLQHDTIIFQNNDFEIFIDPDNDTHQYFEIEVNALNTIFDLFMTKPYRNGGDALISYDVPALQSAVRLQGTLNRSTDTDSGWTVEMAVPFRAINFGYRKSFSPAAGSFYRINFSRVEWDWDVTNGNYVRRKDSLGHGLPEHNWVWSPQGVINMHFPERWGYVFFSSDPQTTSQIPATEEVKNYLWLLYYKQKDYYKKTGNYAVLLKDLNIPDTFQAGPQNYGLTLSGTGIKYVAAISESHGTGPITIDEEGRIREEKMVHGNN